MLCFYVVLVRMVSSISGLNGENVRRRQDCPFMVYIPLRAVHLALEFAQCQRTATRHVLAKWASRQNLDEHHVPLAAVPGSGLQAQMRSYQRLVHCITTAHGLQGVNDKVMEKDTKSWISGTRFQEYFSLDWKFFGSQVVMLRSDFLKANLIRPSRSRYRSMHFRF